jgi:hypothetical protein
MKWHSSKAPDDDSLTSGYMLMAKVLCLIVLAKILYTFREKVINLSSRYVKVEVL